jgi:hypothetical protein
MEINLELIKKNLNILMDIYSDIMLITPDERSKIYRCDDLLESLSNVRLNMWYINPGISKNTSSSRLTKLLSCYQTSIKLTKMIFVQKKAKKVKLKGIESKAVTLSTNIYHIKIKNSEKCELCNSFLIRFKNFQYCQKCSDFKGKIYLFKDDETDDDIKQNKTNIPKHFEVTLNKIYGSIDEKHSPPEEAINKLRDILKKRGFDINNEVHYSWSLMMHLKKIGEVQYDVGKRYNFGTQTAHINHILQRLYPELEIPELTSCERTILENTFLKISSEFQQLYPTMYSSSYQYTIHRILHMLFPRDTKIRTLLRFIYLQGHQSFKQKDDKLNNINNILKCFKIFAYLPEDIYTNKKYYII